jgi:pimeloyl-ACP methyl ester carboxylesterase
LAEVFHASLFAADRAGANSSAGLVRAGSADDVSLATLPFHNPDNLYRYARLTTPYIATPFTLPDNVKGLRTLVMTGNADTTASPESSHTVAELMPAAEFVSIDKADHYSLYWDDAFMKRAVAFARETLGQSTARSYHHG